MLVGSKSNPFYTQTRQNLQQKVSNIFRNFFQKNDDISGPSGQILMRIVHNPEKNTKLSIGTIVVPRKILRAEIFSEQELRNDQNFRKSDQIRRVKQNFAAPPGA